jgi:membrane protease YdiL (CAAX protease family)
MSDQAKKNPLLKQGWLRVVLFGVCFAIITLLIAIPAVMIVTDVKKEDLQSNLIGTLAGLLTGDYLWLMLVLECTIALLSVWIFRKWVDRKSISSLGLEITGYGTECLIGLFMGPALLGIISMLLSLSGHLKWVDVTFDPQSLGISLGMLVLISLGEELVFRGYILGNLLDTFNPPPGQQGDPTRSAQQGIPGQPIHPANPIGSPQKAAPGTQPGDPSQPAANPSSTRSLQGPAGKWAALAISSLLFAGFHLTNPGMNTLAFANIFLAGILLGMNYIYTRNLWYAFLFHLSWNFVQGPILGMRVSGLNLPSLLQVETKGDSLLTGGEFGMEASVLYTAVSITAILILAWGFERKYTGKRSPGKPASAGKTATA